MPIEYINRKGDRYFLIEGKTKTGKPKYYASRKAGAFAQEMPDGFEFYEHPEQALVIVRKIPKTAILPGERDALTASAREFAGTPYFIVDTRDDSLVIYSPGNDPLESVEVFDRIMPMSAESRATRIEYFAKRTVYVAMLRFRLVNPRKRLFAVDRWCFLGSIDDWFPLAAGEDLETLARRYLPHLGKESFFELM